MGSAYVCNYKTRPARVTKLEASSTKAGQVSLTWKKVKRADGYRIYRSETGEKGSFERICQMKGNKVWKYTDSDLKSKKKYYYVVRAYTYDGEGARRVGRRGTAVSATVK